MNFGVKGSRLMKKNMLFNTFADKIQAQFPCFTDFPLNWDSLRSYYYQQISDSTSKGKFHSLLSYLTFDLNEPHLHAFDNESTSNRI